MPRSTTPHPVVDAQFLWLVGDIVFGRHWIGPLGRALHECHPNREETSEDVMRAWALGQQEMPDWLPFGLWYVLANKNLELKYRMQAIDAALDRLTAVGAEQPVNHAAALRLVTSKPDVSDELPWGEYEP